MAIPSIWLPLNMDFRNNGILTDTIVSKTGTVSLIDGSPFGKCHQFTGGNMNLRIPYRVTQEMTFCCWMKIPTSANCHVLDGRTTDNSSYGPQPIFFSTGSGIQVGGKNLAGSSAFPYINPHITIGEWTHIAVVYQGAKCYLYKNGNYIGQGNTGNFNESFDSYLTIGNRCVYNGTSSNSALADVRVYNCALSILEIKELVKGLALHYTGATPIQTLTTIKDNSGCGHTASIMNTVTINSNSGGGRYNHSMTFAADKDGLILPDDGISNILNDNFTFSFWIKSISQNGVRSIYFGCYDKVPGFSIEKGTSNKIRFWWNGSPNYFTDKTVVDGVWNHIAVVKTGTNGLKIFVNGEQAKIYSAESNGSLVSSPSMPILSFPSSNLNWYIARDIRSAATADNSVFYKGDITDFRIYGTALSDNDILKLYQVAFELNKNGNGYSYEFIENSGCNNIKRNGIIEVDEVKEILDYNKMSYDTTLYTEPDGSTWMHIAHHNNPASKIFLSNDTFTTGVYKDTDRWFWVHLCNYLSSYEFMVKQKTTSSATEKKWRWIQKVNPMIATAAQVAENEIKRISSSGYEDGTVPNSSDKYAGLYKKNSSTYLSANNTRPSSWWGALGAFSQYQGGIPGWAGEVITTGYIDLYVRIYTTPIARVKEKVRIFNEIVEK